MSQLCQLADVKNYLGVTASTTDSILLSLITNASSAIETYCNRTFLLGSYTETRNGTGGYRISPYNAPVISVSQVSVDGIPIPAAPALNGSGSITYGYLFDSDLIYIRGGIPYSGQPYAFNPGIQNIYIGYTAGYAAIPYDVNQACIELVASKFGKRDRIDRKNEVLAQQTVGYDLSAMPSSVKSALAVYRRWTQ